ncbi:MAG: electron transfer flavoprotein subunit alpha/FixB family protein, partial [Desulfocapsaceae bacterium]|nr:electron transfer flavoprotein subunit alpha/FixB family protein [Desulfocapsaceae bacterium]
MKALLVAEFRNGSLPGANSELIGFAEKIGAESSMFLVGEAGMLPPFAGTLYLADASVHGEYNPDTHKQLLLSVIKTVNPDMVVFSHSSYGWDLAPRIACALKAAQISEVVDVVDGIPVVPVCNSKLRRQVQSKTEITVITLQAGAFGTAEEPTGSPSVETVTTEIESGFSFGGYEEAEQGGVDLSKADVIVSGGRGIGQAENIAMIAALAQALGGEYGASRPVVDAEWAEHNRQVGTTGQNVSPKLYIACGISGAIQHLAGMKKSDFVIAVNT